MTVIFVISVLTWFSQKRLFCTCYWKHVHPNTHLCNDLFFISICVLKPWVMFICVRVLMFMWFGEIWVQNKLVSLEFKQTCIHTVLDVTETDWSKKVVDQSTETDWNKKRWLFQVLLWAKVFKMCIGFPGKL